MEEVCHWEQAGFEVCWALRHSPPPIPVLDLCFVCGVWGARSQLLFPTPCLPLPHHLRILSLWSQLHPLNLFFCKLPWSWVFYHNHRKGTDMPTFINIQFKIMKTNPIKVLSQPGKRQWKAFRCFLTAAWMCWGWLGGWGWFLLPAESPQSCQTGIFVVLTVC